MKCFLQRGIEVLRRRLLPAENGNALVETALSIAFLGFPILAGTVELSGMMYDSIEVSNAARAGAAYGMISSTFAANSSGIVGAAQGEAPDFGAGLAVTPTVYYACSNALTGTQYASQSAAASACTPSPIHSLEFISVSTSVTVTPSIRCPGIPSSFTLSGFSVMEVEE